MCVVSMVVDSAREQWPRPSIMPYPVAVDLSEVIRKLGEIDKKLGAKDCYDSKKDAYIAELAARITALEQESKKSNRRKPAV